MLACRKCQNEGLWPSSGARRQHSQLCPQNVTESPVLKLLSNADDGANASFANQYTVDGGH